MKPLESYNLFEPETAENPFEYYRALLAEAPVYEMPAGGFIVSSHAHCLEAIRDHESFSSKFIQKMMGPAAAESGNLAGPETLLSNDPPSHTYFRKLVNKAFSPNRVKKLTASIEVIADELVNKLLAGPEKFDAVAEFCVPLPVTVIADQLGVPRTHLGEFKKWSDATIVPLGGMATPAEIVESIKLVEELKTYLAERCEVRRLDPKDDLLSDLVTAEVEGERAMEIREAVSLLQQFLVAGNETTTNLIAATLMFLLQHPDQLERVRGDQALLINAIEEAVRLETPTCGMWRVTTRDVDLAGVTIPEDSMVMLRYAAANRDPAVFENPDAFDIDRENSRDHLAYGMGIHFCPGASLAREETRIGVGMILDRLPGLRLADGNDFAHHPSMLLRGLKHLDLEFETN